MSSGITTPPSPLPAAPVAPPTECEVVIQKRLRQTQRQVKGTDIAGGLITLAIGVLVYLLAAAVVDHWLITGGLRFWGRLWLWLALVAAAGTYFGRRVLPMLLGRISPIFAAATIEKSQPSLKNSLINFLLLRGRRQEVAAPVYQAMEYRAAADLTHVEVNAAVDQTHLIRLGYVLTAVVAVFLLYLVLLPKNPIRSAARVLWPWSNVEPPTRVTIHDVKPRDATAFYGDSVSVSAEIAGLRDGEPALLIYSTADGQTVDQSIPMTRPADGYRYECRLPPGKLGLQQDHQYYLAAGDSRSSRYRVAVQIAPAITVDKVLYHYPAYTGIADRTVARQGDLQAIEGTEVTIHATANAEIRPGTAEVDLGCTGRHGLRMSTDDRAAVGRLTLRLDTKDTSRPEYDSYQLRFADLQGRANERPIRHRIEVIRDLPPDNVEVVEPRQDEVQVAVDGNLVIRVRAEDPDFALRRVTLQARHNGRGLPIAPLLDKRKPDAAWPGEFAATYVFQPVRLKLKAGDRVEYWVEAEDNKEPVAGLTASRKQGITVVGPESARPSGRNPDDAKGDRGAQSERGSGKSPQKQQNEQPGAQNGEDQQAQGQQPNNAANKQPPTGKEPSNQGQSDQQQNKPSKQSQAGKDSGTSDSSQDDGKQDGGKAGQGKGQQQGDKQTSGEKQAGQGDQQNGERIDPDTDPGGAMQEILKDRQQQKPGEQAKASPSKSDNQQSQPQQSGEKASEEKSGGEKSGGEKTGGEKTGGEKSGGEKAGGEKTGGEKAGGEKSGGEKSGGEKSGGEKSGGEKSGGEKASGEKTAEQRRGDGQPAQEKPGADTTGGERSGSKAAGQQKKQPGGEQTAAENKSGQEQPGERPSPGAGRNVGNNQGSPAPQVENLPREKKPGQAGEAPGQRKGDRAQSPSTSKDQSDSRGETAGDRSGGGQQGGGQQANQRGIGGPGTHTPADEGGSAAHEQGEGEVGNRPGDQAVSKTPTGSAAKQAVKKGTGEKAAPGGRDEKAATGGRAGETPGSEAGAPQQKPGEAGEPNSGTAGGPNAQGSGQPAGGGKPGATAQTTASPAPVDTAADEANLEYARRQSALALEHLRDQLAKEKPALLDQLGWTKEDARRFLDRWEQMQQAAAETGPKGDAARKHLDDTLKSLGLRPRTTELRHGGVAGDEPEHARDAGRFAPPPDWAEQFREYTRGVAGGQRK